MTDLTVATYNLGDGPGNAKQADLDQLRQAGAQVICLQEAGDRRDVLDAWCDEVGWIPWRGSAPGSPSVPVLHDPELLIDHRSSRLAVPAMVVGSGAGPSVAKAKAITAISVAGIRVMNTHLVASATVRDASRLRRLHYNRQIAALAKRCRRQIDQGQPVVAVGDFNASPEFALLDRLRELGMAQQTNERTRDRRIIDHVWTSGLTPASVKVLDLSSDHRGVVVHLSTLGD